MPLLESILVFMMAVYAFETYLGNMPLKYLGLGYLTRFDDSFAADIRQRRMLLQKSPPAALIEEVAKLDSILSTKSADASTTSLPPSVKIKEDFEKSQGKSPFNDRVTC
jgi:hypothetical protein